jgi:hypothetical protein
MILLRFEANILGEGKRKGSIPLDLVAAYYLHLE